jgi:hypothetical protein
MMHLKKFNESEITIDNDLTKSTEEKFFFLKKRMNNFITVGGYQEYYEDGSKAIDPWTLIGSDHEYSDSEINMMFENLGEIQIPKI